MKQSICPHALGKVFSPEGGKNKNIPSTHSFFLHWQRNAAPFRNIKKKALEAKWPREPSQDRTSNCSEFLIPIKYRNCNFFSRSYYLSNSTWVRIMRNIRYRTRHRGKTKEKVCMCACGVVSHVFVLSIVCLSCGFYLNLCVCARVLPH